LRFFQSSLHLRCPRDRAFPGHISRMSDHVYTDDASQHRQARDALWGSAEGDFLVSIRYGFLPLRLGDRVVLEPYMPHRCAHQFGLDQDIPLLVPVPQDLSADLDSLPRVGPSSCVLVLELGSLCLRHPELAFLLLIMPGGFTTRYPSVILTGLSSW